MAVNPRTLNDFIVYYHETFVPAYSDATIYQLKKPEQVLLGMENILAHTIQSLDSSKSAAERQENLEKAFHHLERATLDCYKVLWVWMQSDLGEIIKDQEMRKFFVNVPEGDFLKKYEDFISKIREARKHELNNVGGNISKTVDLYKQAIASGNSVCNVIDKIKILDYKETRQKWAKKITLREVIIGVVAAIIGGVVLHYLWP